MNINKNFEIREQSVKFIINLPPGPADGSSDVDPDKLCTDPIPRNLLNLINTDPDPGQENHQIDHL